MLIQVKYKYKYKYKYKHYIQNKYMCKFNLNKNPRLSQPFPPLIV